MLVPDIIVMGLATESHAEEHRKLEQNADEANSAFERIQNLLLKQVLEKAAQEGSGKK